MNAKQIWQSALERIRSKVSQSAYTTWFSGTSALSLEGNRLTVRVGSTFGIAHLENRFQDLIGSVLNDLIGAGAEVYYVVGHPDEEQEESFDGTKVRGRIVEGHAEVLPLSDEDEEEPAELQPVRPLRQAPLMTVAAARHERLEAAQQGRRLPRRSHSYTGPELLPVEQEQPASTPLLTQLYMARDGQSGGENPPASNLEPPVEEPARAVVVEAVEARVVDADPVDANPHERGPERPTKKSYRSSSWEKTPSGNGPGASDGAGSIVTGEGMLNSRYTFSTFIVGKSNQMAHAASQSVAESPGHSYNPLFLYGGVGLGKTHLLHAIGHCGEAAGLNVLYTTSDRFTNEIINAIRFHTTEEFRAKYRQIDVLLVDDVQFIAGKESTEEEFFHTFNTLHNANKQIVLTSDRMPKAMATLQDRLRSRFEWGLLADIVPPEYEHRLAILRSKLERMHVEVDNDVINFIATPECASVRELEGSLNRVIAYAQLHKLKLDVRVAMDALEHLRNENRSRTLDPERVM
ncbi:MAG TPA: chromosomal replication initiator protein DnaA, partial [Ktedonobacterales bacterium]|nr:chromosomal replication initiator protein DnaA [Ktedonobacterales bacterium]